MWTFGLLILFQFSNFLPTCSDSIPSYTLIVAGQLTTEASMNLGFLTLDLSLNSFYPLDKQEEEDL